MPLLHRDPRPTDTFRMTRERLRGTSIVWRFAITSLVVFALIGVGVAARRADDLRARSEEAATVRAELIAEGIVAPLLRPPIWRDRSEEPATRRSTARSTSSRWRT